MTLIDRLGTDLPLASVTVELDDIQATVLRYRPEPHYGTHVMLHVEDAPAGRDFLRRLTPHVDSAADWWQAGRSWISVAVSYAGLVALGVPNDSLCSPEHPHGGMAPPQGVRQTWYRLPQGAPRGAAPARPAHALRLAAVEGR